EIQKKEEIMLQDAFKFINEHQTFMYEFRDEMLIRLEEKILPLNKKEKKVLTKLLHRYFPDKDFSLKKYHLPSIALNISVFSLDIRTITDYMETEQYMLARDAKEFGISTKAGDSLLTNKNDILRSYARSQLYDNGL